MPTRDELLTEKKKYGLPENVSAKEQKFLDEGMPIQKIMGYIQFDKIKIRLNHNVLIPRYETEEVIEESLKYIDSKKDVLDLCTGSGFIGLTVKYRSNANVTMTDISDDAIRQTKENAKLNNLDIKALKSNMFDGIDNKFDVIISNPPYIPTSNKLDKSVTEFEPLDALFAGHDGNDFYRIIVKEGPKYLKQNGVIICEISQDNSAFLKSSGFTIKQDINGKDRIAIKVYN